MLSLAGNGGAVSLVGDTIKSVGGVSVIRSMFAGIPSGKSPRSEI